MFRKSRHKLASFVMVIVGKAAPPEGLFVGLCNDRGIEKLDLNQRTDYSATPRSEQAGNRWIYDDRSCSLFALKFSLIGDFTSLLSRIFSLLRCLGNLPAKTLK